MPTMLNAALSALTPERSGSGSALMTAMRQVGATIGVAVLGTVLNSVYRSKLAVAGLPADVAAAARSSVGAGVQVALQAHSPQLLAGVHLAYASGVDVMLWVCAGIAIAAAVLAALFLPRQPANAGAEVDRCGRRCRTEQEPGQNDWHDRGARQTGRPPRAQEGQDACSHQAARAPAVPGAGLRRDDHRADRRCRRGIPGDVLPLLPDQGGRRTPGRLRHRHPRGAGSAAAGRSARSLPSAARPPRRAHR